MTRFQGKVAVVTGGRSGIGRSIADRLRDEGAHVFTLQRGVDPNHDHMIADLADPEAPARVVAQIVEAAGRLDILV
ncbi:MAG: SDR family NAD(P)-dependent oxidoreductase, partial [Pseudomonadota bacterium]|nr:SDR family NAD(P)-dependent oxidoreductase [Pseudomonadota bacterium]